MKKEMIYKGDEIHFLTSATLVEIELLEFERTAKKFVTVTNKNNPNQVCTIPYQSSDFIAVNEIPLDKIEIVNNKGEVIDTMYMHNSDKFLTDKELADWHSNAKFRITKDFLIDQHIGRENEIHPDFLSDLWEYCEAYNAYVEKLRKYWFESHITLEINSKEQLEKLQSFCQKHLDESVKIIEFTFEGNVHSHVMTSHKFKAVSVEEAVKITTDMADVLKNKGKFNPLRIKTEAEPSFITNKNSTYIYHENHYDFKKSTLEGIKLPKDLHVSYNTKKPDNLIITVRDKVSALKTFQNTWGEYPQLKKWIGRMVSEYAVYDTNPGLDDEWFNLNNKDET